MSRCEHDYGAGLIAVDHRIVCSTESAPKMRKNRISNVHKQSVNLAARFRPAQVRARTRAIMVAHLNGR